MNETKLEQLRKWMNDVEEDVSDLVYFHHIFKQTNDKLKQSKLSNDNPLLNLFSYSYYSSAILAINRQVDFKPPVVSLMRIMKTIQENINDFTEDWYVDQYGELLLPDGTNIIAGAAKSDWNKYFKDKTFVDKDINDLIKLTTNTRLLRDKRIAHKDDNFVYNFDIKLTEISRCIELIDTLTVKYSLLLNQTSPGDETMFPAGTDDTWQEETFYKPWLIK